MTHASPPNSNAPKNPDAGTDADFDDLLAFTPVPMQRRRADGWSAERQRRFITALSVMGAVGPAARAVGMGRASAYRLRERAGAAGFAEAWDIAIACGADLQFHTALDQAINGVTTVRVMRGGMVEVMNAPDRKFLNAALLSKTRLSAALSAQALAVKATRETLKMRCVVAFVAFAGVEGLGCAAGIGMAGITRRRRYAARSSPTIVEPS